MLDTTYALTTTTADKTDIVTPGDVLVLKKSNFQAVDVKSVYPSQNKYANGGISQGAIGRTAIWLKKLPGSAPAAISDRTFVSGEKLWLTGVELKDTGVTLVLFSDPFGDTRFEGRLAFPFEKGRTPTSSEVMATLAEVFSVEPRDNGSAQQQPPGSPPDIPAASAPPNATAPPKTIGLGQTPAQVIAVLGQPDKIISLGGVKQMYVYKDLKVSFASSGVTDVQ